MSERRLVSTPTEWWQVYIGDCGSEKPSKLSQILAETIPAEPRTKRLLDIGCGTGVIGLYCLLEKKAGSVTFTDIRHEWIDITHANISLKIEEGTIAPSQVEVTDAMPFDRIPSEVVAQHDMVVFNLPQFPEDFVSPGELSKIASDPIRARYRLAGRDGLKLARNFCHWHAGLRQPRPDAIFVLWSILGKRQIEKRSNRIVFNGRLFRRRRFLSSLSFLTLLRNSFGMLKKLTTECLQGMGAAGRITC